MCSLSYEQCKHIQISKHWLSNHRHRDAKDLFTLRINLKIRLSKATEQRCAQLQKNATLGLHLSVEMSLCWSLLEHVQKTREIVWFLIERKKTLSKGFSVFSSYWRQTEGKIKREKMKQYKQNHRLKMRTFVLFFLEISTSVASLPRATIVHRPTTSKKPHPKVNITAWTNECEEDRWYLQLWYAMKMSIGWHWKVYRHQVLFLSHSHSLCVRSCQWMREATSMLYQLIHITYTPSHSATLIDVPFQSNVWYEKALFADKCHASDTIYSW